MAFSVQIVPLTIGSARSNESFIRTISIEDVLNYSKCFGCGDYKKQKCDEEATQLLKCFLWYTDSWVSEIINKRTSETLPWGSTQQLSTLMSQSVWRALEPRYMGTSPTVLSNDWWCSYKIVFNLLLTLTLVHLMLSSVTSESLSAR